MAWYRDANQSWDPHAEQVPILQTFATPAVVDPKGGYRLYGMKTASQFLDVKSSDGKHGVAQSVLEAPGVNISVGVDPLGTWWAYYNRTDADCLANGAAKSHAGRAPPVPEPIEWFHQGTPSRACALTATALGVLFRRPGGMVLRGPFGVGLLSQSRFLRR